MGDHSQVERSPASPTANESRKRKRTPSEGDERTTATTSTTSGDSPARDPTFEALREHCETHRDAPFTVKFTPKRKAKRKLEEIPLLEARFGSNLNVCWGTLPVHIWEHMRKFKRFTVGDLSVQQGDCIYVKHDHDDDADGSGKKFLDRQEQWKAIVIEIRAVDGEHVFVTVAWLNRPEDLPGGRKAHHGLHELIPSNQLDVINAESCNGKLTLLRWDDCTTTKPSDDLYYYRQTFDYAYSRTFSPAKPVCLVEQPEDRHALVALCSKAKCKFKRLDHSRRPT